MGILWAFLPDQAMVLVIAGIGLALILGLVSRRTAFIVLGGVMLLLILSPFVQILVDSLPTWLLLILLVFVFLSALRWLSNMAIGRRSTDHMVGILAADLVRGGFRLVFAPVRRLFRP